MEGRYKTEGPFGSTFEVNNGEVRRISDYKFFPRSYAPPGSPDPLGDGCSSVFLNGCIWALPPVAAVVYGYRGIKLAFEKRPVMPWEKNAVLEAGREYKSSRRIE